jgi:hypothetical protein
VTRNEFDRRSAGTLIEAFCPDVSHFDLDLSLDSAEAQKRHDGKWRTDRRGFRCLPHHEANFEYDCLFTDECNGRIDLTDEISSAIKGRIPAISGVKQCSGTVQPTNRLPGFRCDCRLNYTIHIGFT